MSKIVRYEFMGNWFLFWVLSITVIGIPVALLYLISGTLRIESAMDDPEKFVERFRAGQVKAGPAA